MALCTFNPNDTHGYAQLSYGYYGAPGAFTNDTKEISWSVDHNTATFDFSFMVPTNATFFFLDSSSSTINSVSVSEFTVTVFNPGSGGGGSGPPGANGINGTNGAPGINGTNGAPGINGTNGAPGINGTNGAPGINGTNAPGNGHYVIKPYGWISPDGNFSPTNSAGNALRAAWLASQQFTSKEVISSNDAGWITTNENFGVNVSGTSFGGAGGINGDYYISDMYGAFPWVLLLQTNGNYFIQFDSGKSSGFLFTIQDVNVVTNFFGSDTIDGPWTPIGPLPPGMSNLPTITRLSGYQDTHKTWSLISPRGGQFDIESFCYIPEGLAVPAYVPFDYTLYGDARGKAVTCADSNILYISDLFGNGNGGPVGKVENLALTFSNVSAKSVAVCIQQHSQFKMENFIVCYQGELTGGQFDQTYVKIPSAPGMLGVLIDGSSGFVSLNNGYISGCAVDLDAQAEHLDVRAVELHNASCFGSGPTRTNLWKTNDSTVFPTFVLNGPSGLDMASGRLYSSTARVMKFLTTYTYFKAGRESFGW